MREKTEWLLGSLISAVAAASNAAAAAEMGESEGRSGDRAAVADGKCGGLLEAAALARAVGASKSCPTRLVSQSMSDCLVEVRRAPHSQNDSLTTEGG